MVEDKIKVVGGRNFGKIGGGRVFFTKKNDRGI